MNKDRFFLNITLAVVLSWCAAGAACAGFGFGSDDLGKSGLNFSKGYDVNTVTTVSGRVVSAPRADDNEHVFVDIKAGADTVSLSLGPRSTWEKREIQLRPNDEISAKGSKAQGKDGRAYLMVQRLNNRTTGAQTTVRNERGGPPWMGGNAGGMMRNAPGGGMMRGGGGMMRR